MVDASLQSEQVSTLPPVSNPGAEWPPRPMETILKPLKAAERKLHEGEENQPDRFLETKRDVQLKNDIYLHSSYLEIEDLPLFMREVAGENQAMDVTPEESVYAKTKQFLTQPSSVINRSITMKPYMIQFLQNSITRDHALDISPSLSSCQSLERSIIEDVIDAALPNTPQLFSLHGKPQVRIKPQVAANKLTLTLGGDEPMQEVRDEEPKLKIKLSLGA